MSDASTILPDCPLCATAGSCVEVDQHDDGATQFHLASCTACGAQFWNPLRNPGASWYERDERYAGRNSDPILAPSDKHFGVMADLAGQQGTVLDIGCGVGNFLALAEKKGWKGWGIDFDADAIAAGKRTFGLERLAEMDIDQFIEANPGRTFDLVTFFDVLEHVDQPARFIACVRDLLTPGGAIALSVPYRDGARWLMPHDLPPRHLTRWDESTIRKFLARFELRTVRIVRLPATIYFIALKLKGRYGRWASLGIVARAKASDREAAHNSSVPARGIRRTTLLAQLAKLKDLLLFGVPATLVWIALLPSRKRYTDFYVIARKD